MLYIVQKKTTLVSLNWIEVILFGEKRYIERFYEDDYENENVIELQNNNSSDKKVTGKFENFFLVKIAVMNVSFWSSQQEVFYENKFTVKTFSRM